MIFFLSTFAVFSQTFCRVEVENENPIERSFIDWYLTQKVEEILLETGWVRDCKTGKTVKVIVKNVEYRGSSISGNRFSGYTFSIDFDIKLPKKVYSYSLSKYVSLPDPSLGTIPIRYALKDVMELYQIRIKRDLLEYRKEFGK